MDGMSQLLCLRYYILGERTMEINLHQLTTISCHKYIITSLTHVIDIDND